MQNSIPIATNVAPAVVLPAHGAEVSLRTKIGRVLCVVVPVALWFAPLNLEPQIKHSPG
jgi:hypothetical protein